MHVIGLHDLDFDIVPIERLSTRGFPYVLWQRIGMPRISEHTLDSVFFLYASVDDALAGRNPGGSGFVVSVGAKLWTGLPSFHYGVTNWHVCCDSPFSVIRLNTRDGGTDILDLGPEHWEFIPGGPDIAVTPLTLDERHKTSSIRISSFAPRNPQDGYNTHLYPSVGDDIFMLGLFVDHNGRDTNVPSARFGNISAMPSPKALIEQPNGFKHESYVVDMHCRGGFSGSPVFMYRTFGSDLTTDTYYIERLQETDTARGWEAKYRTMFYFLGATWGQFPEDWIVKPNPRKPKSGKRRYSVPMDSYIEGWSGMTCVVPSWDILEVLELPKLKKIREEQAASWKERPVRPRPQSLSPSRSEENSSHREDFSRLLNAAARKREQED